MSAIKYCHDKEIAHGDLNTEKILLEEDMNIKIADFGFSTEFTVGENLDTPCGSLAYAAPETHLGKEHQGAGNQCGVSAWFCMIQ